MEDEDGEESDLIFFCLFLVRVKERDFFFKILINEKEGEEKYVLKLGMDLIEYGLDGLVQVLQINRFIKGFFVISYVFDLKNK